MIRCRCVCEQNKIEKNILFIQTKKRMWIRVVLVGIYRLILRLAEFKNYLISFSVVRISSTEFATIQFATTRSKVI